VPLLGGVTGVDDRLVLHRRVLLLRGSLVRLGLLLCLGSGLRRLARLGRLLQISDVGGPPLARLMSTLYSDRSEWERAQRHLLELARTRFDRASFQRTLLEAMSHVGVAPPARAVSR